MSVSQAGREFLIRDTSAPPLNQLMQYEPRLKEESPAIPVPGREPHLISGVERPGNQSWSRAPETHMTAVTNVRVGARLHCARRHFLRTSTLGWARTQS
jgi:hypothetical protein